MPIEALPQNTTRAIGSTSVIADAYSVVKELIDNALDASASSLQVEISQNTVDVIQLKDNGDGITPEDQKLVCKRAFTSKIQTLDDLRNIGGSSLGFRGEALASVAEMSGAINVTTRVESEIVGLCAKYGRDGEMTGTQRISHPVGTTVRITDFLKHIPVRRQTALKSATKTLTRIKKLLQSYAMSQPSKRLSLKVLKAKNENNNWSYAPSADASLQDAALKVVGAETASSCVLKRLSSQSADAADVASSPDQIRCEVVAFLPDIQPETPKINNMGQYISVDGRPLSNSRGIGQEITKIFKTYIRSAISKSESPKQMTDPFLGLQILCSRGIYDVNIEPAKDDVMFEDRDLVLALVTRLFREQYGETESEETTGTKQRKENSPKRPRIPSGFDVLMARKPVPESHTGPLFSDDHSSASTTNARLSQQKTPIKDITGPTKNVGNESNGSVEKAAKRLGSFNPESISRINASFQTPLRGSVSQISPRSRNQPSYNTRRPEGGHNDQEGVQCSPTNSDLPSPPISRIHLGSPVRSRRPQPQASPESSPEIDRMSSFRRADRERDRERYGNGALDTWFLRTTQVSLEEPLTEEAAPLQEPTELPLSSLAEKRFGSEPSGDGRNGDEQHGACLEGSSQDASSLLAHNTISPPDQQDDQDHTSMDSGRGFPVLERWAAQLHQDGAQAEPTDLEKALDFEKRKREAIQSRRLKQKSGGTVPSSQQEPIPQSSQNSRYLAAKAALTSTGASIGEPFSATKLAPNDPRAYLIRNQDISVGRDTSEAEVKGRRLLTSRLPFERIPDCLALYNMGIKCSVDQNLGPDAFNMCAREDEYTRTGDQAIAFSPAAVKDCLPLWNARLQQIMKDKYESKDDLQLFCDKVDISSAITQHLNAFDTEQV